jgi:CheY-like chemotaxis protein
LEPALIITDLVMPKREGIETIRESKRRFPKIPILAISASGENGPAGFLKYARKLGADDCLEKPFSPDDLRQRVQALCPV